MAKKISKGTPVRGNLSASFFNETNKMRREWRARGNVGGGPLPGVIQQRSVVWVKSVGAAHDPVGAGGIMQLYQLTDNAPSSDAFRTFKAGNPTPMLREPIIPVQVPSWSLEANTNIRTRRFVVLIDRLESGGVARAVFQGPTYAKIKLGTAEGQAFRFAQILPDETGHLEQAPTGYAEILMREAGDPDDVVDALILIGGEPSSLLVRAMDASDGSGSTIIRCKVQTTSVAGSDSAFQLTATNTSGLSFPVNTRFPALYRQNQTQLQGLWLVATHVPPPA